MEPVTERLPTPEKCVLCVTGAQNKCDHPECVMSSFHLCCECLENHKSIWHASQTEMAQSGTKRSYNLAFPEEDMLTEEHRDLLRMDEETWAVLQSTTFKKMIDVINGSTTSIPKVWSLLKTVTFRAFAKKVVKICKRRDEKGLTLTFSNSGSRGVVLARGPSC